jgi:RNA polymerase sigma factor (sigma-70 family)
MTSTLEQTVEQAQAGNKSALEQIVEQVQDMIYGLALRMLWHPDDAQDATQEILIRLITHLSTFRGESSFKTWVYRVASNYLITVRKSRLEEQAYTFERFGTELDEGLSDKLVQSEIPADEMLLLEEVKIGCTLGMLLCLDRLHRLAYILGEILEFDGREAAEILEIAPTAFRKRLSRARADILAFMKWKCGIANPNNSCRCHLRVNKALALKRIDGNRLLFAHSLEEARQSPAVIKEIQRLVEARRAVAIYRTCPQFAVPESFVALVRKLIDS